MRAFYLISLIALLTGCSSRMSEAFKKTLSFLSLIEQSSLVLISNTSTQAQPFCSQSNTIIVQKSFPAGRTAYCKDLSTLESGLAEGPVCEGGVSIQALNVSSEITNCVNLTVCGIRASNIRSVGKRSNGDSIDELQFNNLPWGCNAKVEYSFDPAFSDKTTSQLQFYVQPPECPFCARQNKPTCLTCSDLTDNEKIQSGQVVLKSCSGTSCKPCEVLKRSGQFIPHGEARLYFKTDLAACDLKCAEQSLLRVCNNGLWQGDPSFEFPDCSDAACGCRFPGQTLTYTHGAQATIFKTQSPACGTDCGSVSLTTRCNDGVWNTTQAPIRNLSDAELSAYPEKTCSRRVCHCERTGRQVVADGQSKSVFSKALTSCTERCSDFSGVVTCNSGTLSSVNPQYLNYGFDTCQQEDCGCRVPLATGSFVLLANGASTTLYKYDQNSVTVPNACTAVENSVTVTCVNKILSPYNASVFRYNACTTRSLSCTFTDGGGNSVNVDHQATITVSKTSTPECGEACENLTLTCNDRVFEKNVGGSPQPVPAAELALYRSSAECMPKNCDCNVNGFIIPYGASDPNFYKIDKITNCDLDGCATNRATLTCERTGARSSKGDNVNLYLYKSCEAKPCACPVPWGGTIENGKTLKVFTIDKATCQDPNQCNLPANSKIINCINGVLDAYDPAVYRFASCAPQICYCIWGNVSVPIGSTLAVYEKETVLPGERCASFSKTALCNENRTWSGARVEEHPYTNCNETPDDGTGGGTGGGTGNDEGPGSGIKKRVGLSDGGGGGGGGGPCLSFGCRLNNISNYIQSFHKKACILPWNGGEIEFYGSVSAFDKQCVVKTATSTDSCSKHRIVRMCHYPKWTGSDNFRYPSCEEKAVCPP